jgi:hypothetical protein
MKRFITGTCLAAAFAVGLSAQSTPPQTPQPQTPQAQPKMQESSDAAKMLSVTGCLKAGDTADSFILSDLKWNKEQAPGAVGTSGSAAPPAAIASASTLKLKPGANTKLGEHVGKTVEVTGSVSADRAPSAPAATPPDPASTRPAASGPIFEVRNVKQIAATCSAQ